MEWVESAVVTVSLAVSGVEGVSVVDSVGDSVVTCFRFCVAAGTNST